LAFLQGDTDHAEAQEFRPSIRRGKGWVYTRGRKEVAAVVDAYQAVMLASFCD